ncbi:hypothetical protein LTR95_015426 [Oleoguttula sp. CCFEE 5521]
MPYMYPVSACYTRDPKEILGLINPDTNTITCVGHAPSKHRRCRVAIARHNLVAADRDLDKLSRPGIAPDEGQAQEIAIRWFQILGPGTAQDDQDSSDHDVNDEGTWESEDDAEIWELRRQLQSLIARKRAARPPQGTTFEGAQAFADAAPWSQHTHDADERRRAERARAAEASRRARAAREAKQARLAEEARLAEADRVAEEARIAEAARLAAEKRRREAERQAQREREKRETEARARTERNRQAKEKAEQYRRDRERREQEVRRLEAQAWRDAWTRYTQAFDKIQYAETQLTAEELDRMLIWPTRVGTRASCESDAVREFFENMPGDLFKADKAAFVKRMRRQAAQWHPDKTARTLANLSEDARATALMISQVANGLMGS